MAVVTPRVHSLVREHRARRVGTALCLILVSVAVVAVRLSARGIAGVPPDLKSSTPSGYHQVLDERFSGGLLNSAVWNPYLTSAAARGAPWNSNARGGSAAADPGRPASLDYDGAAQLTVDNGLSIVAKRQPTPGILGSRAVEYTWRSGAISTYGKFEFAGGIVNVVAKVPTAPGMWPGIFLLPGKASGAQSDNYEIDLFEGGYRAGSAPSSHVDAWTLHTPQGSDGGRTVTGTDLGAGYHDFGLDWVPGKRISWYLDGRLIGTLSAQQLPIPTEPMELLIDLQVAAPLTAAFHTTVTAGTPPVNAFKVASVAVDQIGSGA